MALTVCTCSGTPVYCVSICWSALAPTTTLSACLAKRSKKPSSCGINRCKSPGMLCDSPWRVVEKRREQCSGGPWVRQLCKEKRRPDEPDRPFLLIEDLG